MGKLTIIDETTLKKLPYWKRWLYKTLRKAQEEKPLHPAKVPQARYTGHFCKAV